jgi:hypothetical protein
MKLGDAQVETLGKTDGSAVLDSDGTVLLCLHAWGAHDRFKV